MIEVLILERDAEYYAAGLRNAFPDLEIRAATGAEQALAMGAKAEVIVALAQDVSSALVEKARRLRWIAALTTGIDPLLALTNLPDGVIVTSGRGIHGPQMAELAFFYMIALSRNLRGMMRNQERRVWRRWPQPLLLGKTVTLIGVGAISEEIAARCKVFGMNVVGVSSSRTSAPHFDRILSRQRLAEAAALADFLIVVAPYDATTHHLIDADVLHSMKDGSIFINIARGNVVDETALIRELQSDRLTGAGLDVFSREPPVDHNPLWAMDHVIMTPHIGGMSDVYAQQALPALIANMRAFLDGRIDAMPNRIQLKKERYE